jgi:signal transduction histidine kinase
MKQLIEDKKIVFIKEIEPGLRSYCDRNMILNVVRNLFSNAIKFTNEGGSIKITVKQTEDDIEISIQDTGVGISSKSLEKLFKIDMTKELSTKGTAGEKGSGLGLILCKEFVERSGGQIAVKSEIGKGSVFSFTINKAMV